MACAAASCRHQGTPLPPCQPPLQDTPFYPWVATAFQGQTAGSKGGARAVAHGFGLRLGMRLRGLARTPLPVGCLVCIYTHAHTVRVVQGVHDTLAHLPGSYLVYICPVCAPTLPRLCTVYAQCIPSVYTARILQGFARSVRSPSSPLPPPPLQTPSPPPASERHTPLPAQPCLLQVLTARTGRMKAAPVRA